VHTSAINAQLLACPEDPRKLCKPSIFLWQGAAHMTASHPCTLPLLQVDGGEVVIVTAENFWNELSKVCSHTVPSLLWCC
jgi:hypothetical protein